MSIERQTIAEFLDAVAAKQPTPGGGAVASVVAALAAALGAMVVNYSLGKKKLIAHDALHHRALEELEMLRREALALAEADAAAYGRLNELMRLDANDSRRQREWGATVDAAIAAPQEVMQGCARILQLLHELAGATSEQLASDLAIATVLAEAGARAAAWNLRINLPLLSDSSRRTQLESELTTTVAQASQRSRAIEDLCAKPKTG
jgi:formiminotetrahydrofolate cyclodeaminase